MFSTVPDWLYRVRKPPSAQCRGSPARGFHRPSTPDRPRPYQGHATCRRATLHRLSGGESVNPIRFAKASPRQRKALKPDVLAHGSLSHSAALGLQASLKPRA